MNPSNTEPQPHDDDRFVEVTEVGTRDGLQIEPVVIPAARKIGLINDMIAAGIGSIEVTSFVSPKAVPQLADAEEVIDGITRAPHTRLLALVPNLRAAERAVETSLDAAVLVCSASNTHNRKNLNRSVDETLARHSLGRRPARRRQPPRAWHRRDRRGRDGVWLPVRR